MGTDYVRWFGNLQQELDDAKHNLVQLNDNIRRIIGRRSDKHRLVHETKKPDTERTVQKSANEVSKFKKRNHDAKSVFNRLSAAPPRAVADEEPRPRLTSRVIREMPSRQEVVAAQGTDSESRARNRRMFGSLLGTLQKFCQEESRLKDKEDKKAQIEKKLEEQEVQERETLKKERESLFLDRKRKQVEIKTLELKMNRLKDYELWESSTLHLKHYIRTKTKPHIYFKPRIMCKKLDKLLAESKSATEHNIEKKRDQLNRELKDLESSMKMEALDGFDEPMDNLDQQQIANDEFAEEKIFLSRYKNNYEVTKNRNGNADTKENKLKPASEAALSSSVVVVPSHKHRNSS